MSTLATTKLSTRGQVVLPEAIRKALGLKAGSQFEDLISEARTQARKAGLKRADIVAAIAEARARR